MTYRTTPGLVATYRIQLRNGVGLDEVRDRIPWLRELGISHIYLSPLFSAAEGSTHGYDVTDPNAVDPVLGGEEAFRALSRAARDAGLGIVLDIVPNHMAFTPDNPYLADVMREGAESRFAQLFDIDWSAGPLHFAVLDRAPAELLSTGDIVFGGTREYPSLRIHQQDYALRASDLTRRLADGEEMLTGDILNRLLAEQHWQVGDWRDTADAIVHRRFFNISSLVGVRQDDPEVFAFTHRWIVEQVRAGRIQGLRVDHIDGLARPGAYLRRLRDAVGFIPIWVEKIVKDGETIPPAWPIEGLSGYEFMTSVTQLLTNAGGLQALRDAAKGGVPEDYAATVRTIRRELLSAVFAPEVDRGTAAAMEALAAGPVNTAAIRAAIMQLAIHWPVYRSYAGDALPLGPRLARAVEAARADHLPSEALGSVFNLLSAPDDALARAFAARFEQLTGALTAKSEEDTAFYRVVDYLPFCEVGAEPNLEAIDADGFAKRMAARAEASPCALDALSTHDTKRSADARAALVALTYLPDPGARLYTQGRTRARERGIDERWGIYAAQIALMMQEEPDREARVAEHVSKAMRESKDASSYENPNAGAEEAVRDLALDLTGALDSDAIWSVEERRDFAQIRDRLILAQVALQLTAPGIPDIYQGTEISCVALSDPDNRRLVDWARMSDPPTERDARKLALTRELIALRRDHAEHLAMGSYEIDVSDDYWTVRRQWKGKQIAVEIERPRVGASQAAEIM